MARYREEARYQSYNDDWDDADDDWDDGYDDEVSDERALVAYDDSQELDAYDDEETFSRRSQDVLVIPGAGLAMRTTLKRRKRPLTLQVVLGVVIVCVLVTTLFAFGPITDGQLNAGSLFGTLSQAAVVNNATFILYRARSGDTLDSIATSFGVFVTGIQKLNNLTAIDEIQVGNVYKIPLDPSYGKTFKAALPPGLYDAGGGLTETNYYGTPGCMFCSHGGRLNDDGATHCAPSYITGGVSLSNPQSGNVTLYSLVNPNPGAHWVRGFTYFHDGDDISTGTDGTPLYAAQAGQVIFSGYDNYGSGWALKINHCGGLATSYSHMHAQPLVKDKDYVQAGQLIGYQGNTGQSFGAHLHFMLWWTNIPIDPLCGFTQPTVTLGGYNYAGYYRSTYGYNNYGGCPPNIYKTVWNP